MKHTFSFDTADFRFDTAQNVQYSTLKCLELSYMQSNFLPVQSIPKFYTVHESYSVRYVSQFCPKDFAVSWIAYCNASPLAPAFVDFNLRQEENKVIFNAKYGFCLILEMRLGFLGLIKIAAES